MGSSGRVITTADILDGTITPADIDPQSTIDRIMASNGAGAVGWNQLRNGMVLDRELAPIKVAPGGVASTVMRTSDGATASFGKIQAADMDAQPGSAVAMLLNYVEAADLMSNASWTGGANQPFGTAKTFTVQAASSLVEVLVRVGIFNTTAPAAASESESFLLIDGTLRFNLGSPGSNAYGNPFAGAQPVYVTGLAPGNHTVQVFGFSSSTTNGWYCRPASFALYEHFAIQVIEHKIGLGIKGDKGDTGASAMTAGGPRLALNYVLPGDIVNASVALVPAWTTIIAPQNFTVDAASSLIGVSIQAAMMVGGEQTAMPSSRLLIDGVTAVGLGSGMYPATAGPWYSNPMSGGSTAWLGSLSPGTHSVAVQFTTYNTNVTHVYCRPVSEQHEWFHMQVIEHKLGGAAWIPRGAWSGATLYGANDVVSYNGSSYVALQSGTNQNPSSSPTYWTLLAAVGATGAAGTSIVWRGVWSAGAAYIVNDAVTNAGTTYICILASTGHNPASDGGVHWQVMVATGSMVNPMTTADDIIKGGSAGVPTRVAKGANSRVFGVDASGVLGYRQVVDADVAAGPNIAWEKLKGQGYPMTVPGSVDGTVIQAQYIETMMRDNMMPGAKIADGTVTSAKIADNSIVGGDINTGANISVASLTLSGGIHTGGDVTVTRTASPTTGVVYFGDNAGTRYIYYDGAVFHFAGQVNADSGLIVSGPLSIPARSITNGSTVLSSPSGAVAGAGWSYASVTNGVSGLTPGKDFVLVIMTLTHSYVAGGVAGGIGIGVDRTDAPSSYTHFLAQTANIQYAPTVSLLFAANAATHNFYGLIYTGSASANVNGWPCPITVITFHA